MGLLDLEITVSASGSVPADTAWQRYYQLEYWPVWSPHLRYVSTDPTPVTGLDDDIDPEDDDETPEYRTQSDQCLSPGLTGRVHGLPGLWAKFTVLTLDKSAMRWSWRVHRGPLTLHLDHQVWPTPEGSRTSLTLRGPGPVILGYVPLAWYALHRLVSLPAAT